MEKNSSKSFKERIEKVKTTRWIRFAVVSLIFFFWVVWLNNYWVLLVYPLLFDIYITLYIPWNWWKKSEHKTVRTVMSWVDSIVYALILVYSGGAGLSFQIAKGFFDTVPVAVDEAALLDGCTRWQIFTKITLPLSKPIVIYTVLTSFMSPWLDFIFAKVICRANSDQYTIAIGLWKMLEKEYIDSWYTCFAAGAVLISIPIAALFLYMQRYYVDGLSGAVKG